MKDFDTFTKIAENMGNLVKIIAATGFEKLPKVQQIAKSGHTECIFLSSICFIKGKSIYLWLFHICHFMLLSRFNSFCLFSFISIFACFIPIYLSP